MFNKKFLGYVDSEGFLGEVVGFDFLNQKVVLQDAEEQLYTEDSSKVELMQEVGEINGLKIFEKDIFTDGKGAMYEIQLHQDGLLQLHKLDKVFNRVASGEKFKGEQSEFEIIKTHLELVGNIYSVKSEQILDKLDFNIKVVKDFNGENYTYFYACHNKEKEEIDLIKVVFVGHKLLEEEDYTRATLSYEVYIDSLDAGTLIEVSPQELLNFATGVAYKSTETPKQKDHCDNDFCDNDNCECFEEEDNEDDNEDEVCEDCGYHFDDCKCEPW